MLNAIGIRYVGEKAAETLAAGLRSIEALLNASQEEIAALPGIGAKIAHSVYNWAQLSTRIANSSNSCKAAGLRMALPDDGGARTDGCPSLARRSC